MYSKCILNVVFILALLNIRNAISCEDEPHNKTVYLKGVSVKKYGEANECSDFTLLFKDRHPTKDEYLYSVYINIKGAKGREIVHFSPSLDEAAYGYKTASFCLRDELIDMAMILIHSKAMGSAELVEGGMKVIGSPGCMDTEMTSLRKAINSYKRSGKKD